MTNPADFPEDQAGLGAPLEGYGVTAALVEVAKHRLLPMAHRGVAPVANKALGDFGVQTLHQIQPGSAEFSHGQPWSASFRWCAGSARDRADAAPAGSVFPIPRGPHAGADFGRPTPLLATPAQAHSTAGVQHRKLAPADATRPSDGARLGRLRHTLAGVLTGRSAESPSRSCRGAEARSRVSAAHPEDRSSRQSLR